MVGAYHSPLGAMPEPLSQVYIESEIVRLSALAERVTTEIAQRARDSALADSSYKREHAKAYLMAAGKTVGEKEAQTALECDSEFTAKRVAEALLLAAQEAGRNYRAQLEALRSLNANLRPLVTER